MSTRSLICQRVWGKIQHIYVHNDGYPEGVGLTLFHNYGGPVNLIPLFALGDLSSLGESADTPPPGHSFDSPVEGYCVAYGRDRGEEGTEAQIVDSIEDLPEDFSSAEYVYLYEHAAWHVAKVDWSARSGPRLCPFRPLEAVLDEIALKAAPGVIASLGATLPSQ